ncbi:MAG: hypothetical protein E3J90_14210 [Promethearchaeota archaeon]|nr:MAG: hypothetical protein E3J90_14210 [Candidatus Lokiarchaeota archaeon]
MGYLLATVWFPPHKGEEVGKKFLEIMKKFPEDRSLGKTVLDGALMRTKYGIKAITISEVREGKLDDGLARINEILALYSEIEGVNTRVDTMATLVESMEMVGLKPPK